MLAARITLPHFSVSSAMSLPKSAGEPASTMPPRSAMRFDRGVGEAGIDLPIELVNNVGGRVLGRADAEPLARLIARHEFSHSWDARQRLRARRGRYCERAQPTSPDMLD